LSGDSEAASSAMKKHATEFGEILVKMEETYRKKINVVTLDYGTRK
jgi:DNA-binding FadR family transcriptional regulator